MVTTKPGDSATVQIQADADYPYVMRLPDGRTICVAIPGCWVRTDRPQVVAFEPEAMVFLDRIRAVFVSTVAHPPSPAHLLRLREGLGCTQREFGERIGVDKMTVSRWERGVMRPRPSALQVLESLRKEALGRGVAICG